MKNKLTESLLLPLSTVYGGVLKVRNYLYDKNILRSAAFNFPLICVGNLAMGGTGKTPMTEYLVKLLMSHYPVATLSRGYKRKTKGFALAGPDSTALEIGDEPMQIHRKFPGVSVAVAEERLVGIPQLLHERPETKVIILDDAFQHRPVKAGLNILLTDFRHLYTRSRVFPAGNLRDVKSSSNRANLIVVTKCPTNMNLSEKNFIVREIAPLDHQQVFFTKISYGLPYHLFGEEKMTLQENMHVLLVCGVANPTALQQYLESNTAKVQTMHFKDHHIFTSLDLKNIKAAYGEMSNAQKVIVTTEKDAVRLAKFRVEMEGLPIFVLPMEHEFLFDEKEVFDDKIMSFVKGFQ